MTARNVQTLATPDAVAAEAAARTVEVLAAAVAKNSEAHLVLTGGTVGIKTAGALAQAGANISLTWENVHLWWGDERFVAAGTADRNDEQAREVFWEAITIPPANIHRMPALDTVSDVELGAATYAKALADAGNPVFDVVLLGFGPDAHVASLFPGHERENTQRVPTVGVENSPKPPPLRVSLTFERLNNADTVILVGSGAEKGAAVAEALAQDPANPASLPLAKVAGKRQTLLLIDEALAVAAEV